MGKGRRHELRDGLRDPRPESVRGTLWKHLLCLEPFGPVVLTSVMEKSIVCLLYNTNLRTKNISYYLSDKSPHRGGDTTLVTSTFFGGYDPFRGGHDEVC